MKHSIEMYWEDHSVFGKMLHIKLETDMSMKHNNAKGEYSYQGNNTAKDMEDFMVLKLHEFFIGISKLGVKKSETIKVRHDG